MGSRSGRVVRVRGGRGFRRGVRGSCRGRFFLWCRTRTRTKRPRALEHTRSQATTSQRFEDTLGEIETAIRTARALILDGGGKRFAIIRDGDRGPTILGGTRDITELIPVQRDDVVACTETSTTGREAHGNVIICQSPRKIPFVQNIATSAGS